MFTRFPPSAVQGRDAVGNLGWPTNVTFRTDLAPPAITATAPLATNTSRVSWTYTADDGPLGTGGCWLLGAGWLHEDPPDLHRRPRAAGYMVLHMDRK